MFTIDGLIQLLILFKYSLKMVTGNCDQKVSIFLYNVDLIY